MAPHGHAAATTGDEEALVARRFADIDADIAATEAMAPPQGQDEEFDEADMAAVRAGSAQALAPEARDSAA
ncbi:hypothetical protein ACFRJ1_33810 [Streptomyces sp. NPDC056773]|uniref:hypothetical protein n=1 Tax=unclassified Streptomyces TaxID=2593676 RepID=UPI0036A06732